MSASGTRPTAAPPDPSASVFVNCPFDEQYEPLLRALIFAIVSCGFIPRSANETGSVATPRLARILDGIFSSRYAIHDLSRCKGEGAEQLARFNMPLELGISMARRHVAADEHDWLVLVPKGHAYQKYVSDLAGIDPKSHDSTQAGVARGVMSWLYTHALDVLPDDLPLRVMWLLPRFDRAWAHAMTQWGEVRWWPIVTAAQQIVSSRDQYPFAIESVTLDGRQTEPSLRYKAKLRVVLRNDADVPVRLDRPQWVGTHVPAQEPFGFAVQLEGTRGAAANDWLRETQQPIEIARGQVFRVWIGLDPSFSDEDLQRRLETERLGRLNLTSTIAGRVVKASFALGTTSSRTEGTESRSETDKMET